MIDKKFEEIKDDICFRLINSEKYKEILEDLPHVEVLDLSAIYYYKKAEGYKEGAIIDITNEDMKMWDISIEELDKLARENTVRLLPPVFQTIEQVIDDIANEEGLTSPIEGGQKERMYVLTNREKYYGGGCFLYQGVMEKIAQQLGTDFFLIPSSTHENIIMPEIGQVTAIKLLDLVADMNARFLEEDEVLSNAIYRYDEKRKELDMVTLAGRKTDMGDVVLKKTDKKEDQILDEGHIAERKRR